MLALCPPLTGQAGIPEGQDTNESSNSNLLFVWKKEAACFKEI